MNDPWLRNFIDSIHRISLQRITWCLKHNVSSGREKFCLLLQDLERVEDGLGIGFSLTLAFTKCLSTILSVASCFFLVSFFDDGFSFTET